MLIGEIVSKLHEYYELRDRMKVLKLELIKIAIDLGQEQKDAMDNLGAINFLDGFLISQGVMTKQRNNIIKWDGTKFIYIKGKNENI
jgi:hypothetical protein